MLRTALDTVVGPITISGDTVTPERGVRVAAPDHEADVRDGLAELMLSSNELHPEIERVYRLDDAAEALARVQAWHVRGKLVLSLD